MSDLSKYRPHNYDWVNEYIDKLGIDKFQQIDNWTCNVLKQLEPGRYYDIQKNIPEQHQDLFIKLCADYVINHDDYLFSDDYTKIKRLVTHELNGKIWYM
ncbi:MAG: hypothetical protein MJZ08_02600 [Bacteroidaceae bacterium]|nr:hypothetical protein [Bacteroidaceae bacterium]